MDIKETDIKKLLQDDKLIDEIVKKVVEDPKVLDELADDIADELSDYLEDDPAIRQKIIDAAIQSEDFKKRIVAAVRDELGDD